MFKALFLLPEPQVLQLKSLRNRTDKHLTFGLGTGRCGTYSLTKLLNAQPNTEIRHEAFGLPWKQDETKLYNAVQSLFLLDCERAGDVGYYWLPYVSAVLSDYPDAKFVCLSRAREEVVESFFNHTPNRNFWTKPDSEHWSKEWKHTPEDLSFPRYDLDKRDALNQYWLDYHKGASGLEFLYPDNFHVFHISTLNSREGQEEIFDFIGIPESERVFDVGVRINVTDEPLVVRTPVTVDGISCAFCDDRKASWRINNKKNGSFAYACEKCGEPGDRLGLLNNSITV